MSGLHAALTALRADEASRFWDRVKKTDTCWLWTSSITEYGYGVLVVRRDGKSVALRAHRLSFALSGRSIPEGMVLDHICRVRHCVNPDHLRPLDNVENVMIGISPAAINARKTHCKRGHEFNAQNTRINADGSRACRQCHRANQRERQAKAPKRERRTVLCELCGESVSNDHRARHMRRKHQGGTSHV